MQAMLLQDTVRAGVCTAAADTHELVAVMENELNERTSNETLLRGFLLRQAWDGCDALLQLDLGDPMPPGRLCTGELT